MGYKAERFVGQDITDTFLCVVCNDVLQNAKELPCDDFCCETCLANFEDNFQCPKCDKRIAVNEVRDPPRLFYNFYDTFKIECSFEGCNTLCFIAKIREHEEVCENNPKNAIYCDQYCGVQLSKEMVKSHHCGKYFLGKIAKIESRIKELEEEVELLENENKNRISKTQNSNLKSALSSSKLNIFSPVGTASPLGPMGKSLKKMIHKFNNFTEPRIYNPNMEWRTDCLYKILVDLITNNDLKNLIESLDIRVLYDNREYKQTLVTPVSNRSLKLLLTLLSLEYLLDTNSIQDKNILLIGIVDYCILPYFAHFAKNVVTNTSDGTMKWYQNLIREKLPSLAPKIGFRPHFSDIHKFLATNNMNYDAVVALDRFTPDETKTVLEVCCKDGFVLLLNKSRHFEKRILNLRPNGDYEQRFETLENSESLKQLFKNIQ